MNTEQLNKLEKTLSKGKWYYIIVHGAIGWGISTGVLFSLLQSFTHETSFIDAIELSLILFPIGGICWGASMWFYFNKQYNKLRDSEL